MNLHTKFPAVLPKQSTHSNAHLVSRVTQFAILLFLMQVLNVNKLSGRNNFDFKPLVTGYSGQQKVFIADVNGGGFKDIIMCDNNNDIKISLNNGNLAFNNYESEMGFLFNAGYNFSLGTKQLLGVSDMNGDSYADLIVYDNDISGSALLLYINNNGNGFNSPSTLASLQQSSWHFEIGNINVANSTVDIVGYNPSDGKIWVLLDGSGSFTNWITITTGINPVFYFGNFDGQNDIDLAYSYQDASSTYINVLKSDLPNLAFNTGFPTSTITDINLKFFQGDFDNDGDPDLAVNYPSLDIIKMLINNVGASFSYNNNVNQDIWGVASFAGSSMKYTIGNFRGEGKQEILKLYANGTPGYQGSINLLFTNTAGNKLNINTWELQDGNGIFGTGSNDWQMLNADFNNDGLQDILCFNPTESKIRVGLNIPKLEGYCWPLSGKANGTIDFHLSGRGSTAVEIRKFESTDNSVTSTLITTITISPPAIIATNDDDYKNGCNWLTTFTLSIDPAWESGYYAAKLIDARGRDEYVTFIVSKNSPGTKKVALIANTNTWAVYNPWSRVEDGRGTKYSNIYNREYTFMRPNPIARPTTYDFASEYNGYNLMHRTRAELWIYSWLKNNGYEPNVITDADVDQYPNNLLNQYAYLIMGTHPEYWSEQMYNNVKQFQTNGAGLNGGNLICIGGNAVFEACKLDMQNKQIIAYPDIGGANQFPITNLPCGNSGGVSGTSPYNNGSTFDRYDYFLDTYNGGNYRSIDLIGTHYQVINNFDENTTTSYTIPNANLGHILFDGITNPQIGTVGYNKGYGIQSGNSKVGGASGRETDCYSITNNNYYGIVANSIYSNTIQVIAGATTNCYTPPAPGVNCGIYNNKACNDFPNGVNYSEIIYVKPECAPSERGFVFTAGSITFGGSLAVDLDIQTLMKNVLDHLEVSVSWVDLTCANMNNGSITVSALMANNNSTYNLQPLNITNNTGIFTNLAAGVYTITASYGNNNTYSVCKIVTISQPSSITWVASTATDITCNNANDGSISTTATGGTGTISYNLQPTNQNNITGQFNNLSATIYTVTATDANACTATTTFIISNPPAVNFTVVNFTNIACGNANDGSISANATGGTGTINYSLQPINQNNITGQFNNLAANTYTLTATDANGCSVSTTITIIQPPQLSVTASYTAVTCNGLCNATAQATASGGTPPYLYTITAPGIINVNTGAISGLCAGAYTLTATDANGCSATSLININQPNVLNVSISNINNVICNGLCDATAQAAGSGGTVPYQYSITAPGIININSGAINGLCAGAYTVTTTDANNCTATTTFSVTQPPQLLLTITQVNDPPCALADGSISFTVSGGTGIITFTANNNPTGSPFIAPAGTYTINATDANGCTQSTVVILQNTGMIVNAVANPSVICAGDQSVLTASGANTYTWQPGNLSGAVLNVTPASNTIYTVTGSIGPCTATATVLVEVHNTDIVCCNPSLFYNPSSVYYANVSTSTIGAGFSNINTPILLDGVITVDNNFNISYCSNVKMGPGATIVVQPNITLTIDNSNISAACNEMWQGIVATDASEQVNITNSEISDMLGGVLVSNGAKIHSENTQYIDNLTGIWFANTPSNYAFPVNNGVVIKNTFTSSGNNLLPPVSQDKPETGVRIVNCGSVTIGELIAGSHNFFSEIYTGILVSSFNIPAGGHYVQVLNNEFLNINDDYSASQYPEAALANAYYSNTRGAGVFSECGNLPLTSSRKLLVQSIYNDAEFSHCDKAVVTNSVSCNANYNKVEECVGGFLFNQVMGQNYGIRANNIQNAFNGVQLIGDAANVLVYDHQSSANYTAGIRLRELPIQTATSTFEWPRGVDIRSVNNKHTGLVDVYNNHIVESAIGGLGIMLGLTGPNSFARHNTIQMSTTDATPNPEAVLSGILSFGTYSSHVNCNTINGLSGAVFGVRNSTAVMNYESGRMEVACNFVNYTHRGFLNVGDCATGGNNVRGNLHFNHIQGWLFTPSVFNHEGTWDDIGIAGTQDNNNQFFGLYLSGFNAYRWWAGNPVPNAIYSSQSIISGSNLGPAWAYNIINAPNPISCGNTCNSNYYPMVAVDSMINVNEAIELASDTTILPYSMSVGEWMAIRRLYEELVMDSARRVSNPILESFYTLQQQTNISRLYATDMALQALTDSNSVTDSQLLADRISAAHAANNSISNPQGYEWNEKWVNELFIRCIEFGTDSLTEVELSQLEWLAKSCPAIDGTAVWKARTLYSRYQPILSYDDNAICAQSPAYKHTQQDERLQMYLQDGYQNAMQHNVINKAPTLGNNEVKAYPNPANDYINIAYRFEIDEERILEIYDLLGKKIWGQNLQGLAANVPIKCNEWVAGIYHFVIKSKTANYTGKIQIQR